MSEQGDVENKAGERDQSNQLGVVARGVLVSDQYCNYECDQRSAAQDGNLTGRAQLAPELEKQKEYAGRQRQRSEKRSDAHAKRELFLLAGAVDIEITAQLLQQCSMVGVDRFALFGAQVQNPCVCQFIQFLGERPDPVRTLLGCAFA